MAPAVPGAEAPQGSHGHPSRHDTANSTLNTDAVNAIEMLAFASAVPGNPAKQAPRGDAWGRNITPGTPERMSGNGNGRVSGASLDGKARATVPVAAESEVPKRPSSMVLRDAPSNTLSLATRGSHEEAPFRSGSGRQASRKGQVAPSGSAGPGAQSVATEMDFSRLSRGTSLDRRAEAKRRWRLLRTVGMAMRGFMASMNPTVDMRNNKPLEEAAPWTGPEPDSEELAAGRFSMARTSMPRNPEAGPGTPASLCDRHDTMPRMFGAKTSILRRPLNNGAVA